MDTLLLVDYDIYSIICTGTVQIHIDQCKDTYCKGREACTGTHKGNKLKERMPNIAGIYGVSFGSETESVVASASNFPSIGRSPAVSRTVSVGG
jgi:hypothetical protein